MYILAFIIGIFAGAALLNMVRKDEAKDLYRQIEQLKIENELLERNCRLHKQYWENKQVEHIHLNVFD